MKKSNGHYRNGYYYFYVIIEEKFLQTLAVPKIMRTFAEW